MIIPVFGDIHGNIEGMFRTLQFLQRKHKSCYRFVLQVGDFGYFPETVGLDSQTRSRWNEKPERGVHDFLNSSKLYEKYFLNTKGDNKLGCKIIFVRGNHDDNALLKQKEQEIHEGLIRVDPYDILLYLPDGRACSIKVQEDRDIVIMGYGGVYQEKENRRTNICQKSLDSVLSFSSPDVLITHQGTAHAKRGHEFFSALCELVQPKIHIHGHGHYREGPFMLKMTKSYSLGKIPKASMPFEKRNDFYGFLNANEYTFTQVLRHA
jgi:predicted phosphodiesterase